MDAPTPAPPRPPLSEADARSWALTIHMAGLVGMFLPPLNIVAPLLIWHFNRDRSPLVDLHGKECLNFQISVTIYGVVGVILIFVLIGIPLVLLLGLFAFVASIVAGTRASAGQPFHYPLAIRFVP